jgi:hypothetical protein
VPTDPFNEGRVAALIHGRRELNPYKSNPAGESIYTEYESAWDNGFMSVATTPAREGSAATECEEKTADNIPALPGPNLGEIRDDVQPTMPGESVADTECASAGDNDFTSIATTRAREGSAATECEEKTADNILAMPGSNLDEIREYVQRTMPGESATVIDNVTYDLWRKALEAETDSQERTDENFSTRRPELGTRQRPATRGSLRALTRRGLLGRRSHS